MPVESDKDNVRVGSWTSANDLLKKWTSYTHAHMIMLSGDELKPETNLAQTFEKKIC